jgi:hypothetical protein
MVTCQILLERYPARAISVQGFIQRVEQVGSPLKGKR